ncbi:MAG: hydantoinase B/oxoprolinase family protein, partial [Gammaproteobacteria bacterium]
ICEAAPLDTAVAALEAINAYGERIALAGLRQLPDGVYRAQDVLDATLHDSCATLAVTITIEGGKVSVDFAGTSAQLRGNLNCPISVTAAAVYYAFFCLMPRETPACAGSLRPLRLLAPRASLVNASPPAAVAAGNVETSQRIVDVVLRALAPVLPDRIPAASCGSMNNVAMGGSTWDYYETIGGGGGAHAGGAGLDATHTHMTNTLNTPIEIIEGAFPVRIRRYGIRAESGGMGRYRGGAGILREYEFLAPTEVTLLTERRIARPWGLAGGGPGLAGENRVNGKLVPGMVELSLKAGDRLTIATPGGGGWGAGQRD